MSTGNYTVVVDGQKFSVQVAEGDANIQVTAVNGESFSMPAPKPVAPAAPVAPKIDGTAVNAMLPGSVWKISASVGQSVAEGDVLLILESMKMEIDVVAPCSGVVKSLDVNINDKVVEGQLVAVIG